MVEERLGRKYREEQKAGGDNRSGDRQVLCRVSVPDKQLGRSTSCFLLALSRTTETASLVKALKNSRAGDRFVWFRAKPIGNGCLLAANLSVQLIDR